MHHFRQAVTTDIPEMQRIRRSVKENILSDPARVTDTDCGEFINERGKGWVCEKNGRLLGFAVADLRENNIWALFVDPDWEGQGIGRKLHALMLDWYFTQTGEDVWLGTSPGTRAETFYRRAGWRETGLNGAEIRFEMNRDEGLQRYGPVASSNQ
jgi:GNAT superfamily N-acetyltransferase